MDAIASMHGAAPSPRAERFEACDAVVGLAVEGQTSQLLYLSAESNHLLYYCIVGWF